MENKTDRVEKRRIKNMKYYEMALSGKKVMPESAAWEIVYRHDEDDKPGMNTMILPLLALQLLAVLSFLI